MFSLNPRFRAFQKEFFEAFVLEASYHSKECNL